MKYSELKVYNDPKSGIAEAIRIIRTNLEFSAVKNEIKTILVTSSVAGEGKSFVSANLACAFAQNGKKVLLIDCDLRRGRVHELFSLENYKGLSNLLIREVEEEYNIFIHKTEIKNLSVMLKGAVPPNPSELLGSSNSEKLLEVLKDKYDVIILDGAPVIAVTDSLILSKLVDAVVVVSASKSTKTEQLQTTMKALKNVEANVAGVILNKIVDNGNTYYGNYYE